MKSSLFYKDKPVFGFDIGHSTIKVAQIIPGRGKIHVGGYGYNTFNEMAMKDGVIIDLAAMASASHPLITQLMVGTVTTDRVAVSIPAARSFTRILTLPLMDTKNLEAAVRLEAEQYIPLPLEDLYIDYEITELIDDKAKKTEEKHIEVVIVACPRKIIDSYIALFDILDLNVALIETSLIANARSYIHRHKSNKPILLIDFGSRSSDINIFDGALRVAGTVDGGGDGMTEAIAKAFKVTSHQAYILKTRYGLKPGPKQKEIEKAVAPILDKIVREIGKMVRYYKDRQAKGQEVDTIIMSGGGANLPGLAEYITRETKIKSIVDDPWYGLEFGKLQQPHSLESTIYTTAVGLAFASMEAPYD